MSNIIFIVFSETNYKSELWDTELFADPAYYLFILSQCLNAIGFLNLTTFLNVHIAQTVDFNDAQVAYILIPMQASDFFGRLIVPYISDKLQPRIEYIRHYIYVTGVIGTGSCMMCLNFANTWESILAIVILMGFFSR